MSHKLIMESWRQYTEHHELFEKHSYIREVLSIQPMLSEDGSIYYDKNLREQIIQEHLLLEGFFDDLKQMGADAKNLFSTLRTLISDPDQIGSWIGLLRRTVFRSKLKKITKVLNLLISKLPEYNMSTFAQWAQGIKDMLVKFNSQIANASGWKGAMFVTSAALGFQWVWSKIGQLVDSARVGLPNLLKSMVVGSEEQQDESVVAQVKDYIMENIVDPIKEFVVGKLKEFLGDAVYTSVAGWFAWAQKAFDGAKFVLDTLKTAIATMTGSSGSSFSAGVGTGRIKLRPQNQTV